MREQAFPQAPGTQRPQDAGRLSIENRSGQKHGLRVAPQRRVQHAGVADLDLPGHRERLRPRRVAQCRGLEQPYRTLRPPGRGRPRPAGGERPHRGTAHGVRERAVDIGLRARCRVRDQPNASRRSQPRRRETREHRHLRHPRCRDLRPPELPRPRLAGSGRRYCCDAHTTIGRNLANERSRAVALERQGLRDALDGKSRPPEHVGFLATTNGAVLTGQALLELRAAVSVLRSAAAQADSQRTGGLDRPQFLGRLGAVRRAAKQAPEVVEKVLPTT